MSNTDDKATILIIDVMIVATTENEFISILKECFNSESNNFFELLYKRYISIDLLNDGKELSKIKENGIIKGFIKYVIKCPSIFDFLLFSKNIREQEKCELKNNKINYQLKELRIISVQDFLKEIN